MEGHKVFIDSSVLIAAILSSTGASHRLLELGNEGVFELYLSSYVVLEVERVLVDEYPEGMPVYERLLTSLTRLSAPSSRLITEVTCFIEAKDAPIVAGAVSAQATYLATLDRKHLLSEASIILAQYDVAIVLPSELVQKSRQVSNY